MTFISYAQNFEDVMLWRALKHVKNGFYIDVGANDPTIESVTKAFYEYGWRGINIEPLPKHHADLERDRSEDINLQCAVGATHGELDLWYCDVRGWATCEPSVVSSHREAGYEGAYCRVAVRTLAEICSQYVKTDIHFLKIDVEGAEKSVIEGMDFSHFRPWVLVVEATRPNSTEEAHSEWEEIVLAANYSLAYFDGLNRFYVSKERAELVDALRYPPNVFDGFIRAEQPGWQLRAEKAEAAVARTKQRLSQTQAQLDAVYESTSWKLTAPIRAVGIALRDLKAMLPGIELVMKTWLKTRLARGGVYLAARPALKAKLLRVLQPFPRLHARIVSTVRSHTQTQNERDPDWSTVRGPEDLTESGYRVYQDLIAARGTASGKGLGALKKFSSV